MTSCVGLNASGGNSRPTVAHILNGSPVALEQGCYTWRHDCALSTITSALRCDILVETTTYVCMQISPI